MAHAGEVALAVETVMVSELGSNLLGFLMLTLWYGSVPCYDFRHAIAMSELR